MSFDETVSVDAHQLQNRQGFVPIDAQPGFCQDVQEASKFDNGFMKVMTGSDNAMQTKVICIRSNLFKPCCAIDG